MNNVTVKVKKLTKTAILPVYSTDGSGAFDIFCDPGNELFPGSDYRDVVSLRGGESASFKTGLAFEIPKGYVMLIYSRSGHGFKQGIRLINGTGVIDSRQV